MSAELLGWLIGSGVAAFVVNALWTIAWQRNRRIAQREHDSICDQLRRNGRTEIDRLEQIAQNASLDRKSQIADRDATIVSLTADRENYAIRMLSLEDSYSQKQMELDAKNQELKEIKQRCSDAWRFFNLDESIIPMLTFQPKRPEDQPQKSTSHN